MKKLRSCRKTQQQPPKDAVSAGPEPPRRPFGLTMLRLAPPALEPRSLARPCPTDISAPLQLSWEPKPPSIVQDAVVFRPCQMATNHAYRMTSQDCLWSSPARALRWLKPTLLQKCWECISNRKLETCPNFYCYF